MEAITPPRAFRAQGISSKMDDVMQHIHALQVYPVNQDAPGASSMFQAKSSDVRYY